MKMKTTTTLLCICAAVLLACGLATATTVVDNFDGYTDGDLTGQGSAGGGWDGGWNANGSNDPMVIDSGTAVAGGSTKKTNLRTLSTPIPITAGSPTIWISYDLRVNFGSGSQTNSYGGCPIAPCHQTEPGGHDEFALRTMDVSPYYSWSSTAIPDNQWTTLVLKMVPSATVDGTTTFTVWANPNLSLAEDDLSQVAPIWTGTTVRPGFTSISEVEIRGKPVDSGNIYTIDNLRLSNDSSPFVPEPATMTLLAVGALALVKRRGR